MNYNNNDLNNKIHSFFKTQNLSNIIEIGKKIENNNGHLYLVGGCVRDILLDKSPHDFDFCVTGIETKQFQELFPFAIKQGKSFPVYILEGFEFALARKEFKAGNKHTDFNFITNHSISIYDDLIRRDLTINSIAIDVLSLELIDPLNGINDLNNRILKHSSLAFSEDPLRVYRVARFASQLNFKVDSTTISLMSNMRNELINLSSERVFAEFRKALISEYPTNFFSILREANCLDIHFKEVFDLINVEQPIKYHPEGDAYNHTLEVLERTSKKTNDELIRFGALVHDFGKAATPKDNWPHHYEHENLGISIIKNFCKKLKMPTIYLKAGTISCKEHMKAGIYDRLKPGTKIDLFERVFKSKSLTFTGLEIIANADKNSNNEIKFAKIAEEVMTNVNLTSEDIIKINKSSSDEQLRIKKTREILKNKRIKYLLKLENSSFNN